MLQVGGKYRYLLFGSFAPGTSMFFLRPGNRRQGTGGDRDEEQQEGKDAGV